MQLKLNEDYSYLINKWRLPATNVRRCCKGNHI